MSKQSKAQAETAPVLDLVGMREERLLKENNAHWDRCKAAGLPFVKVTKDGKFFGVKVDMLTAERQLSEAGLARAVELQSANDHIIWAKHPKHHFWGGSANAVVVRVDCLTKEIALGTAEALALLASLYSEPLGQKKSA